MSVDMRRVSRLTGLIRLVEGVGMSDMDVIGTSAGKRFQCWLEDLEAAIESPDSSAFSALFAEQGYWKDILSFTGGYRTYAGADEIREAWKAQAPQALPK